MGEIEYLEEVLNSTTNNPSSANTSSKNQDNNVLPITKIISGGQTGVDTIGLQVAKELGIETGGTAPKGFLREEGIDNEDIRSYNLVEITDEEQEAYSKSTKKYDPYTGRTDLNVRNSDGTVYFYTSEDKRGFEATERSAIQHKKPFLPNPTAEELREWIIKNNIKTLNVAGNRGSRLAKDNNVANILREALSSSTSNAINNANAVSNEFTWADKADNSFEVSTKGGEGSIEGDKRFSAKNAAFKPDTVIDGVDVSNMSIEDVYQDIIKKSGKGQAPAKDSKLYNESLKTKEDREDFSYTEGYLPLWQEWARQNPELIEELREKAKGKVLTDMFANTRVSQARALADILNESTSATESSGLRGSFVPKTVSLSTVGYKKGDPQEHPDVDYVFTENAEAYIASHSFPLEEEPDIVFPNQGKTKLNVSDVNGTNQAGIRTDSKGNISSNAYGIVVKKYQQDANGKFVAKEGQFQDTDDDFNLFVKLNEDMFRRLSESKNTKIVFPTQMGLGKAALPKRFVEWLQSELSTRFGINSTIEKNQRADYDGYGLKINSISSTTSNNDINNTDNTNNESGVSNEEQTNNSVTNSNTSETESFDNFVKEAGDAFDEATVNKVKEDLNKQTTSRNTQPSFTFKDGTTVTTDFELNDQQKFALLELEKFFNSEETVFSLQGYAGTGKTTIMKVFDKYLNNRFFKPLYVSPTHKANAVTRANNPEALVKTIHSLLGLSPDYDVLKDSFDLSKIKFSSSGINNTVQGTLIIVDESSMLEDSLADHLVEEAKKNGNRIIFIGDPAQLSPVGQTTESKALNYSGKVELTKVERTGDNAILKDATSLRENNTLSYITDLNDKGDGIIYTNKPATLDFFLKNIVNKNNFKNPLELRILTGENKYIPTYNKLIRNILFGENAPQLVKGDILMGYSNEKRTRDPRKPYEIINSGDYIVDEISDLTEKVVPYTNNKIKVFGYKVSLKNAYDNSNVETFILDSNNNTNSIAASQIANLINSLWSKRSELISEGRRKEASKIIDIINSINNSFSTMFDVKDQYGKIIRYKTFDYAYTQTVHKSQGATYNNIVVLEDTFNKFSESEKQKLKYVALTRAKNKVLYYTSAKVNNRDITDVTSSKIKEMQNNAKRLSELGKERQNECK